MQAMSLRTSMIRECLLLAFVCVTVASFPTDVEKAAEQTKDTAHDESNSTSVDS